MPSGDPNVINTTPPRYTSAKVYDCTMCSSSVKIAITSIAVMLKYKIRDLCLMAGKNMGIKAKSSIAKKISKKAWELVCNRDASTTDTKMAAFTLMVPIKGTVKMVVLISV